MHRRTRVITLALILVVILTAGLVSSSPMAASNVEVIKNGNFEGGFTTVGGCGAVGNYWHCFTNGGRAAFGFYDDQWASTVWDGNNSQLIEINTKQDSSEPDRTAGIYQMAGVSKGATYDFSIRGMIRTDDQDPDPWRYRVLVGFDYNGGTNWQAVTNWQELPWDTYYPRTSPGAFSSYSGKVTATSGKITVFVRVLMKWGTPYREVDFNIDGISLFGPGASSGSTSGGGSTGGSTSGGSTGGGSTGSGGAVQPPAAVVCSGTNLVANGNFEGGFNNGVGKSWYSYTNGGRAAYGFYDDTWPPVVYEGKHAQLIEINTYNYTPATDPNRYAGIYQVVKGLKKGHTYQFSLAGMLREESAHPDEDAYRYEILWGYNAGSNGNWTLANWQYVPVSPIYVRTAPGAYSTYSVQFVAPSDSITLFVMAHKKWATGGRELDTNLDAISIVPCKVSGTPPPPPPAECTYVVKRGDTLSAIAAKYHTTVAQLAAMNHIKNPNLIFVGQVLDVPCPKPVGHKPPHPVVVDTSGFVPSQPTQPVTPGTSAEQMNAPAAEAAATVYVVKRGDTLSQIATRHGVTTAALAQENGIRNTNLIYAGQKLTVPAR